MDYSGNSLAMDALISDGGPELAATDKMKELRQLMLQTLDKKVWRELAI